MTGLLWLPSRPQSFFKIPVVASLYEENADSLYLITLGNTTDILALYNTRIIQLDSAELTVKDEILLEAPIEAFKFDPVTLKLTLKLSEHNGDEEMEIVTVTGKNCTWSLDCPLRIIVLTFSASGAQSCCLPDQNDSHLPQTHRPVLEIIRNDHVASLSPKKLQLLLKSDRSSVSSVRIPETASQFTCQSLIWVEENIFVFRVYDEHFQVFKFSLIQSSSPTNGCNWPLVTWSNDLINVHRAGAICPTWYKLKNSEVWDVLKSSVGSVRDVKISLDGNCLLICGSAGVAICDFQTRSWKSLPFPFLIHPVWLGNSHVIALTSDHQQLILIPRDGGDIMKIPVEEAPNIKFIDFYNNWQLLLQIEKEIIVLGFDIETVSFTQVKRIPFETYVPLKQAAYLKENIFTLNKYGTFLVNNEPEMEECESFLVLSTGHFLITKSRGTPVLWIHGQIHPIDILSSQRLLGVLPFKNCFTLLLSENSSFSLHDAVQSRFLLPDLFAIKADETILRGWKDDPLYQLALEYVLLKILGNKSALKCIDRSHQTDTKAFSMAIVSLSRKIEFHEVSQKLFIHLPTFTPLFITKNINIDAALIFLPYLAKSYFENVDERKDAISLILDGLFTGIRCYRKQIRKIKEYLAAFSDLEELFLSTGKSKIESLWQSGRLIKAFDLLDTLEIEVDLREIILDKLPYFKVDKAIAPELVPPFLEWLRTRGHPEMVITALKNS